MQNDKEIREIKTSLNCLSNHKEIRGLSPSPRTSMSFTPSLYIFSHGEAFEARANIEKTKKAMEISRLIDKLANPLERSVLRLFYLNVLEAWQVAEEIDRSK
ncbi:DUF1492 domain-containing protein, partial [Streptococcus pneumoniae]|uniref:DUF1492 domain-containing protein n=1 Tax=Streptococcus pneumoniae TaxID=1313 RepID=UPI001D103A88